MMHSSLDSFLSAISGLRQHISNSAKKNALLDKADALPDATADMKVDIEALRNTRNDEKLFDYTVIIITLYGRYETFIEQIIKEYVRELKAANYHFSVLPKRLRDGYFSKVVRLYSKIEWEKYGHIGEKTISKSLYESLNMDVQNLLPEAFYTNAGNYKIQILSDTLSELGIENSKETICKYPPLMGYYTGKHGKTFNISAVDADILYSLVDEVVETRNKIAHTGRVDDLKDSTYVEDMIVFFEKFAESLNMLFQDNLYLIKWNSSAEPAFKPVNVFEKIGVAGFKRANMSIDLNQHYLCKSPTGIFPMFIESKIMGIHIGNEEYIHCILTEDNPKGVGIKINHKATEGCEFKFLKRR